MLLFKQNSLLRYVRIQIYIPRRNKGGKRKHSSRKKKDPTEVALNHFDKFYQPVFKDKWPSIRLALLSPKKYCAMTNNYADTQQTVTNLICEGAHNILTVAKETELSIDNGNEESLDFSYENQNSTEPTEVDIISAADGSIFDIRSTDKTQETDLYEFMPTKRMTSNIEQLKDEEIQQNMKSFGQTSTTAQTVPDTSLKFPQYLKAFSFERGEFGNFPKARVDSSGKLDCYMFDAASLLPVLALDLYNKCNVLDLCSAPGGKSLAALQTLMPDHITCVDASYSRLQRLRYMLKQYVPGPHAVGELISVKCRDGIKFCGDLTKDQQYDRVLVDVPCYNDRNVLAESENNLFRPGRLEERVTLPKLQRNLLFSGIKACRPGGVVVYSTCTLSAVQNDGVIESTLEKVWQESRMDVKVIDTSRIRNSFHKIFNFAQTCRYGQLVLPNVTANYGPMYICKLLRVS